MNRNESIITALDWDTKQLGVKTARIDSREVDDLSQLFSWAKLQGYQLLYWQTPDSPDFLKLAKLHHGVLVDHKTTYLMNLSDIDPQQLKQEIIYSIETYTDSIPSSELIALAYESGKYSRFREDSRMTDVQFQSVYSEWIKNSVNHSIAKDVIVINDRQHLLGFATLGEKNHRGDIGLLAVSEQARGKKIGTTLVKAAQRYFIENRYTSSQIVTQQKNVLACKLYEKCGYHVEKVELFFHFWL